MKANTKPLTLLSSLLSSFWYKSLSFQPKLVCKKAKLTIEFFFCGPYLILSISGNCRHEESSNPNTLSKKKLQGHAEGRHLPYSLFYKCFHEGLF